MTTPARLLKMRSFKKSDYLCFLFHAIFILRKNLSLFFFSPLFYYFCSLKGVKLGKNIRFHGNPIIRRHPNSTISFGSGCTFNSAKNSLSIGLNQPCAFATLNENAKIIIGNNSGASGLKIAARSKVIIGNNVLIGSECIILDNDAHHSDIKKREENIIPSKPICIEDNVFIGLQCVILKGVTIGKNSVIGARSVVFNDIPENSIAIGNPCKVIMYKKEQ